jgi:hypothetical protein
MLCANCHDPIPPHSPSDDFCQELCQVTWHSARVGKTVDPLPQIPPTALLWGVRTTAA